VRTPLRQLVDDLVQAMHDDDYGLYQRLSRQLHGERQGRDPGELTAAIEGLVPVLRTAGGVYSKLALAAGAMVEDGGSPLPLREVLPRRVVRSATDATAFPRAWALAAGDEPLPDRDDISLIAPARDRLVADAERRGESTELAQLIAWSWFGAQDWARALLTAMADREFRAAMDQWAEVTEAVRPLKRELSVFDNLSGMLLVLDDEPLVVLDKASGRGFWLTMGGVGDNYQLHTLLADRLSGQVPGLEPPEPAWVAAATDGEPAVPGGTFRRFRLFDGRGSYVYPQGRPADIKPLDGVRVLVLHPPLAPSGWRDGRLYPRLRPVLTLDQVMDPAQAADWLARVAPAAEDDLMARGRGPDS
jgi:hypothetical protein